MTCLACKRERPADELLRVTCQVGHVRRECLIGAEAFVCRPSLDQYRGCVRRVVGSALVHRIAGVAA